MVRDYSLFYKHWNKTIEILVIWDSRRNPEDTRLNKGEIKKYKFYNIAVLISIILYGIHFTNRAATGAQAENKAGLCRGWQSSSRTGIYGQPAFGRPVYQWPRPFGGRSWFGQNVNDQHARPGFAFGFSADTVHTRLASLRSCWYHDI